MNQSRLLPRLMGGFVSVFLAASTLTLFAEYYHFKGEDGASIDGADLIYQETRYPYWAQSTYNARWFPGIAGEQTSTSLYSGPAYSGDGGKGTKRVGYIWSFWGVDKPVALGDSVVPVWWHPNMHDVPSIGEGASGKVEGNWLMSTDVWYPGVLRIWRAKDGAENASMAGQWLKDGVTGKWHHMATFRMPFAANRFNSDTGFIEDHSNGNIMPRRVDFRNYYFRKHGKWVPGKLFKPSTRQETEKGSSGLIENGTAAFFETCSAPSYKGNMGPGSQELTHRLTMPDAPMLDPIVVKKAEAVATPRQVRLRWDLEEKSSPQFACKIELFASVDASGNPFKTLEIIDPDASEMLIATESMAQGVRLTLVDIFDQVSKPISVTTTVAKPSLARTVTTTAGGLSYRYYEGDWKALPAFDSSLDSKLALSGAVNGLDLSIRKKNEGYACVYRGYLEVPVAGLWQFSLRSSDGSRLTIDGENVIDHDGIHGAGYEQSGTRALSAGKHEVEVAYFKAKDGAGEESLLALAWEGPGQAKSMVPEQAWSRVALTNEPVVKLISPPANAALMADQAPLIAAVKPEGKSLQMVRFYQNTTVAGVSYVATKNHHYTSFSTNELLGAGRNHLRARLIYGEKSEYSIDSPSVDREIHQPAISPWQFSAIGKHFFAAASSMQNGTHTLLGDGLNFNWQKITGDTTIVARIKRRPANSWISQFDGSETDGGWSGGLIFRQDIHAHPGSEIGERFVALFASAKNTIHVQDHTNHNAGGLFWGPNVQNAQGTYQWLKLQREGQKFHASLSVDGKTWTQVETREISSEKLEDALYVGVFTLARPSTHTNPNRWMFSDVGIGNGAILAKPLPAFIAHWPMDEGAGAGVMDHTDDPHSGVIQHGATWVDGVSGSAVELNGKDQAVMFPPLGLNSNTVTICGWVKRDGDQVAWSGLAMCRGTSATGLTMGPENQLRFNWDSGKNPSYQFGSNLVLPDQKWAFVALVIEPAKATLYLKSAGKLQSAACSGIFDVAAFDADFYLGRDPNGEDRWFKGSMDEFRVYRKAFSEQEIELLSDQKSIRH